VAWTTMIGGCANVGRAAEAVDLFWRMRKACVKDDAMTMVALLTACAELGHLELGRWVHARVDLERWQWRTVLLDNALIHMYLKCGAIKDARCLFRMMPRRSTISWTTMISSLAMHGHPQEAEHCFLDNYDIGSCKFSYRLFFVSGVGLFFSFMIYFSFVIFF